MLINLHIPRVGVVPVLYTLREVWEERFLDLATLLSIHVYLNAEMHTYFVLALVEEGLG